MSTAASPVAGGVPKPSRLEEVVVAFIRAEWPGLTVLQRQRVIKKTKKSRYEIDILLPELMIGLEVQDLATHSPVSTEAKNPWNRRMKGPVDHERKRELARKQLGVTIVDLWEEEILSGAFEQCLRDLFANFLLG